MDIYFFYERVAGSGRRDHRPMLQLPLRPQLLLRHAQAGRPAPPAPRGQPRRPPHPPPRHLRAQPQPQTLLPGAGLLLQRPQAQLVDAQVLPSPPRYNKAHSEFDGVKKVIRGKLPEYILGMDKRYTVTLFDMLGFVVKLDFPHAYPAFSGFVLSLAQNLQMDELHVVIFKQLKEVPLLPRRSSSSWPSARGPFPRRTSRTVCGNFCWWWAN